MDPALAGLLGAVVGAAAGLGGAVVAAASQARTMTSQFGRQQRVAAYSGAVLSMFRAAGRRSQVTGEGYVLLSKEDQAKWFLDLIDAVNGLTSASAFCSPTYQSELQTLLVQYRELVQQITHHGLLPVGRERYKLVFQDIAGEGGSTRADVDRDPSVDGVAALWDAAVRVQEIAIKDLGMLAAK